MNAEPESERVDRIDGAANSYADAAYVEALKESFDSAWEAYVECPKEELHKSALKLRESLASFAVSIYEGDDLIATLRARVESLERVRRLSDDALTAIIVCDQNNRDGITDPSYVKYTEECIKEARDAIGDDNQQQNAAREHPEGP